MRGLNLQTFTSKINMKKYKPKSNIVNTNLKLTDSFSDYDEIDYSVLPSDKRIGYSTPSLNESTESVKKYIIKNGDVSGDGKITGSDADLIQQSIDGFVGPMRQSGDVNNDGKVDIKDVSTIQEYIERSEPNLSYAREYTDGIAVAQHFQVYNEEPDPAIAINYWSEHLDSSNFVFPKDDRTGKSLGAWPKNYKYIPVTLKDYKTYNNDSFIWPVTPLDGDYTSGYEHNGFDIEAEFGTPIYSPVDGEIVFSSWGGTKNKGADETAYSVTIKFDEAVSVNGSKTEKVDEAFLTHLSGIRYRVDEGEETIKIKKGELLGFVGTAQGSPSDPKWAPHLHLSYYDGTGDVTDNTGYENNHLVTSEIEKMYGVSTGSEIESGK